MNTYNFDMIYKKDSEMPADYLSCNLISAISCDASALQQAQSADPLLESLKNFLLNKKMPNDTKWQSLVKLFSNDCFIEVDIIWHHIKWQFQPSRVVIFLPALLVLEAFDNAHGNLLVGHDGIYKTKECLLQFYYWPGMDADIATHFKSCHKCQLHRKDDRHHQLCSSCCPNPPSLINASMPTFLAH